MYVKQNQVVKIGDYNYKAIKGLSSNADRCNRCDLFLTPECLKIENKCYWINRDDLTNVIFAKIGKV